MAKLRETERNSPDIPKQRFPAGDLFTPEFAVVTLAGKRSVWRIDVWIIQGKSLDRPGRERRPQRSVSSTAACGAFRIWRPSSTRAFVSPCWRKLPTIR